MTVNDSRLQSLHRRARAAGGHIVLPEGTEARTIEAAGRVARLGLARVTLVGEPQRVRAAAAAHGAELAETIDVQPVPEEGPELEAAVRAYRERTSSRGLTEDEARAHVRDPLLWAALQVSARRYDGLVAGAVASTASVVRAALRGIDIAPGVRRVSSFTLVLTPQGEAGSPGKLVLADAAVNPDPSAAELAEIALLSAQSARALLTEPPRLALLSFSTHGSARHARVDKVREATRIVRARAADLVVDGELQADAALVPDVAAKKAPTSRLGGRANVLVFPDLDAADVGRAVLSTLAGARVLGPILQGLERPIGALGPGASVEDIVEGVALIAACARGTA